MNLVKPRNGGIRKISGRLPAPLAAWIHQIHAVGGASGSTTIVMVFVVLLVLFERSCLVIVTCHML